MWHAVCIEPEAGESLIIHYLLHKLGSLMELFGDIDLSWSALYRSVGMCQCFTI